MKDKIITDESAIKKALCFPTNMSFAFVGIDSLSPIGEAKFKGDNFPGALSSLSVNKFFNIGEVYPIYDFEGKFVIGSDGVGKKINSTAWGKIKYYK